jgi:hypothetical protein
MSFVQYIPGEERGGYDSGDFDAWGAGGMTKFSPTAPWSVVGVEGVTMPLARRAR